MTSALLLLLALATVPDVVGLDVRRAKAAVAASGLQLGSVTCEDGARRPVACVRSDWKDEVVVRQRPGRGERVARPATVGLVVRQERP